MNAYGGARRKEPMDVARALACQFGIVLSGPS